MARCKRNTPTSLLEPRSLLAIPTAIHMNIVLEKMTERVCTFIGHGITTRYPNGSSARIRFSPQVIQTFRFPCLVWLKLLQNYTLMLMSRTHQRIESIPQG